MSINHESSVSIQEDFFLGETEVSTDNTCTPEEVGEDQILELKSQRDLRSLAFHLIYAMEQFDYEVSLASVVDNFRRGFLIDIPDDSLAIELAKEVIAKKDELDKQIEPHLKNWKLERLGLCTKLILRLAIHELSMPGAIPNIILNEAIELSKGFAEKDAYKFVNGVLDEIVKAKPDEPKDS
jgi:N utilization substance protein B